MRTGLLLAMLLLASAALAELPGPAASWELPQLMAAMRQVPAATARFVERKQMRVLDQPLQSSGKLIYVAPDLLQKETLTPVQSRLTLNRDRLIMDQPDGKSRDLSLSDYPEMGALVESIRATLAGDLATLTRHYTATLTGGPMEWSLLLEPRDNRLRDLVSAIRIRGSGNRIHGMETIESDGDRTLMTMTPESE